MSHFLCSNSVDTFCGKVVEKGNFRRICQKCKEIKAKVEKWLNKGQSRPRRIGQMVVTWNKTEVVFKYLPKMEF